MSKKREVASLANYELEVPEMRFPATILHGTRLRDTELFEAVRNNQFRETAEVSAADLYFFPGIISNQIIDSYATKMALSSLRNYAADASSGVGMQNSHRSREMSIGRLFNGVLEEDNTKLDGSFPRVYADFYTLRDLQLTPDFNTNHLIRAIEAGIVKDLSIGFKEGVGYRETCSICGNSYWSYECRHIAGSEYEVGETAPGVDPTNETRTGEKQLAFVWIENARLSEVSAVSDGSTPNAMILTKAVREVRAGRLSKSVQTSLENKFRINLTERTIFPGASVEDEAKQRESEQQTKELKVMTDIERAEQAEAENLILNEQLKAVRTALGATDTANETEIRAKLTALQQSAVIGKEMRSALIETTLKEGVRAYGDKFDEAKKRAFLEKLSVEEIADVQNDWTERAGKTFSPGRTSQEFDEKNREVKPEDDKNDNNLKVPGSAYSSI